MISVVLSTYNAEDWLEKVLRGYCFQTFKDFEIVIADDGSGPKTKALIYQFQAAKLLNLQHVWQPDDGFQKSKILNKGLLATKGSYVVMSDGDCIPRKDFLEIHNEAKKPNALRCLFVEKGTPGPTQHDTAQTHTDIYTEGKRTVGSSR